MTEPAPTPWYQAPEPRSTGLRPLVVGTVLVLAFIVGLAVGGVLGQPVLPPPSGGPSASPGVAASVPPNAPGDFGLFWEAYQRIRQDFVGRSGLTDEQLTYGAIKGLVDALGDTGHSVFLTPEALEAENQSLSGTVVGIGVLLGERGGRTVIVSVISGGPASRAELRSGDVVLAVDEEDVTRLAPDEVAPKIRGEAGTTVVVKVQRPATGEQLDFSMVREQISVPAAGWTLVPGTQIGLLRLIQFSDGAAEQLRAARDAAVAAGATSLVLDLRSNPGGYVQQAVDVASLFLTDKTVYIAENADGSHEVVSTNPAIEATGVPLVVLIDEGSASSAEIVAGALRSAERAALVGQTTFGTGTVLATYKLSDGSAVRLATQRWLTPDEELIFGHGITPTIELPMPADGRALEPDEVHDLTAAQVRQMSDAQLLRAIELLEGR